MNRFERPAVETVPPDGRILVPLGPSEDAEAQRLDSRRLPAPTRTLNVGGRKRDQTRRNGARVRVQRRAGEPTMALPQRNRTRRPRSWSTMSMMNANTSPERLCVLGGRSPHQGDHQREPAEPQIAARQRAQPRHFPDDSVEGEHAASTTATGSPSSTALRISHGPPACRDCSIWKCEVSQAYKVTAAMSAQTATRCYSRAIIALGYRSRCGRSEGAPGGTARRRGQQRQDLGGEIPSDHFLSLFVHVD